MDSYVYNKIDKIFEPVPLIYKPLGSFYVYVLETIEEFNANHPSYFNQENLNALDDFIRQLAIVYIIEHDLQQYFKKEKEVDLDYSKVKYYYEPLYEQENCPICLKKLRNNSVKTSCEHKFHQKCLKEWKKHNNSCPLCRQENTFFGKR